MLREEKGESGVMMMMMVEVEEEEGSAEKNRSGGGLVPDYFITVFVKTTFGTVLSYFRGNIYSRWVECR